MRNIGFPFTSIPWEGSGSYWCELGGTCSTDPGLAWVFFPLFPTFTQRRKKPQTSVPWQRWFLATKMSVNAAKTPHRNCSLPNSTLQLVTSAFSTSKQLQKLPCPHSCSSFSLRIVGRRAGEMSCPSCPSADPSAQSKQEITSQK